MNFHGQCGRVSSFFPLVWKFFKASTQFFHVNFSHFWRCKSEACLMPHRKLYSFLVQSHASTVRGGFHEGSPLKSGRLIFFGKIPTSGWLGVFTYCRKAPFLKTTKQARSLWWNARKSQHRCASFVGTWCVFQLELGLGDCSKGLRWPFSHAILSYTALPPSPVHMYIYIYIWFISSVL